MTAITPSKNIAQEKELIAIAEPKKGILKTMGRAIWNHMEIVGRQRAERALASRNYYY